MTLPFSSASSSSAHSSSAPSSGSSSQSTTPNSKKSKKGVLQTPPPPVHPQLAFVKIPGLIRQTNKEAKTSAAELLQLAEVFAETIGQPLPHFNYRQQLLPRSAIDTEGLCSRQVKLVRRLPLQWKRNIIVHLAEYSERVESHKDVKELRKIEGVDASYATADDILVSIVLRKLKFTTLPKTFNKDFNLHLTLLKFGMVEERTWKTFANSLSRAVNKLAAGEPISDDTTPDFDQFKGLSNILRDHWKRYAPFFQPNCPYTLGITEEFGPAQYQTIFTRPFKIGEIIPSLDGTLHLMSDDPTHPDALLDDFSMFSQFVNKEFEHLYFHHFYFCGTARYALVASFQD